MQSGYGKDAIWMRSESGQLGLTWVYLGTSQLLSTWVNLGQLVSTWVNLVHFVSTWFILCQLGSTWSTWVNLVNLGQFVSNWVNLVQFVSIGVILCQLGSIWFNLCQIGSTWFNLSGRVWFLCDLVCSGLVWSGFLYYKEQFRILNAICCICWAGF